MFEDVPRVKKSTISDYPNTSSISTPDRVYDFSATVSTPEPLLIHEQKQIIQNPNLDRKLKDQLCELNETMKSLQFQYPGNIKSNTSEENTQVLKQEPKIETELISITVDTMRSQISSLASHVDSLQKSLHSTDYEFLISKLKNEIIHEIEYKIESRPESRSSCRSRSPDEFSYAFQRHIKKWEHKVLSPLLSKVTRDTGSRTILNCKQSSENPGEILARLQSKVEEKAQKVRLLQEKRCRSKIKPNRQQESFNF